MKRPLLFALASGALLSSYAQNTCSTAMLITEGTFSVGTIDGSEIPNPNCSGGWGTATGSEWYRFTPSQDTAVIISTVASGIDTRFHLYSGACGALVCVGGDDDSGPGNTSYGSYNVQGGVTYRIAFDDRWTAEGFGFTMTYTEPVPMPEGIVTFSTQGFTGLVGSIYGAVDMNGDHLDDVVCPGTTNIHIQRQIAGGFTPMNYTTTAADHTASWSMAAGDIDGNGYNDLEYGGGGGVTFMLANDAGTGYTEMSFTEYVFSQRGNLIDINNDGHLDAFMCHDVDANVYFMNDGEGNLTFEQGEFGSTCGNYGSIWVDYDGDGDQDMFVAKCGCDPVDILMRNNGDGTFTHMAEELGFADNHQSWSSAWGDFDNDLDMDVLVGSSSSSIHKLMRNNGDGTFTDVTMGSGMDSFDGSSIEWTTHDFNNDGYLDILGGGAMHWGNGDLTFAHDETTPDNGPIGDVNNDGFLDIMGGSTAYMNNANDYNWFKVAVEGVASNANGIGARIIITTPVGQQMREIRSGDGFRYMSTLNAHFGLGEATEVEQVEIRWPSGTVEVFEGPAINGTFTVVEGVTIGMAENTTDVLGVYPNPANDVITVSGKATVRNAPAQVFDATGKLITATTLRNGQLDISGLMGGVYLLSVKVDGAVLQQRFTKQ